MNLYNKGELDQLAKKTGFIRDNLEKVLRLTEVLAFVNDNELLSQRLVLKGGTAINLTVFNLPRLSVDIDLDFCNNLPRDEMLTSRELVNKELLDYMLQQGFSLNSGSKMHIHLIHGHLIIQM